SACPRCDRLGSRGRARAGGSGSRRIGVSDRVGQVRGVLAHRVVVSTIQDPFLSLKAASEYTSLSVKTLRRAVNDVPDRALPCYRVGAAILVRRSETDAWLAHRRT